MKLTEGIVEPTYNVNNMADGKFPMFLRFEGDLHQGNGLKDEIYGTLSSAQIASMGFVVVSLAKAPDNADQCSKIGNVDNIFNLAVYNPSKLVDRTTLEDLKFTSEFDTGNLRVADPSETDSDGNRNWRKCIPFRNGSIAENEVERNHEKSMSFCGPYNVVETEQTSNDFTKTYTWKKNVLNNAEDASSLETSKWHYSSSVGNLGYYEQVFAIMKQMLQDVSGLESRIDFTKVSAWGGGAGGDEISALNAINKTDPIQGIRETSYFTSYVNQHVTDGVPYTDFATGVTYYGGFGDPYTLPTFDTIADPATGGVRECTVSTVLGSFPLECSFEILDENESIILPLSGLAGFTEQPINIPLGAKINLYDTWGDGWQGSQVKFTFDGRQGPIDVLYPEVGDAFFNASGGQIPSGFGLQFGLEDVTRGYGLRKEEGFGGIPLWNLTCLIAEEPTWCDTAIDVLHPEFNGKFAHVNGRVSTHGSMKSFSVPTLTMLQTGRTYNKDSGSWSNLSTSQALRRTKPHVLKECAVGYVPANKSMDVKGSTIYDLSTSNGLKRPQLQEGIGTMSGLTLYNKRSVVETARLYDLCSTSLMMTYLFRHNVVDKSMYSLYDLTNSGIRVDLSPNIVDGCETHFDNGLQISNAAVNNKTDENGDIIISLSYNDHSGFDPKDHPDDEDLKVGFVKHNRFNPFKRIGTKVQLKSKKVQNSQLSMSRQQMKRLSM